MLRALVTSTWRDLTHYGFLDRLARHGAGEGRGLILVEDSNMIFFPNRTVIHRDDVVEIVKKEFHKRVVVARPSAVVDQAPWDAVDQASWESFPASDPPPWTLGYTGPPKDNAP